MKKRRRDASLQSIAVVRVLPQLSWEDIQVVMLEACERNMSFFMEYLRERLKKRTVDSVVLQWIGELKEAHVLEDAFYLYYDDNCFVRISVVKNEEDEEAAEGVSTTLEISWWPLAAEKKPADAVMNFLRTHFFDIEALCKSCTNPRAMRSAWNNRSIQTPAQFASPFCDGVTFPNSPWQDLPGPPPRLKDEEKGN